MEFVFFVFTEIKCGRNKATAITNEMAKLVQENLVRKMKNGPFTLSTDGSNDNIFKQFPIVIRTYDPTKQLVNSELLSLPICNR